MSKTIAVAGAGDVAKYLVEEILKSKHKAVVLTRQRRDWFAEKADKGVIELRITDYTLDSLEGLLKDVDVLISLLSDNATFFVETHFALIEACKRSPRCKRFIPSEFCGDIERFPDQPLLYVPSRVPVRQMLADQSDLEHTLFNNGWFMDYFIPAEKTYLKPYSIWPLDEASGSLRICGTGEEPVTFTWARNAAQAIVKLVDADRWDLYTYVAGETTTWNRVKEFVEGKMNGRKLAVTYSPVDEIQEAIEAHKNDTDSAGLMMASTDMWNAVGAAGLPMEKVRDQRERFFRDIDFLDIARLVKAAEESDGVV